MTNVAKPIVAWIYDHRWFCMLFILIITAIALWQVRSVGVDNSLEIWFLENDSTLASYVDFQRAFGSDEMVVIAISCNNGDIISPEGLEATHRATRVLQSIEEVSAVRSLATFNDFQPKEGGLPFLPVITDKVMAAEKFQIICESVLSNPSALGKFVNKDKTAALILVHLKAFKDIDARRGDILDHIDALLQREKINYRMTGVWAIYQGLNSASTRDSTVLILASYLVIAVLLWVLYHRAIPAFISLAAAGMASMWTLGLYGAFGRDINMVSMVLPTLVFIVGLADTVHLLFFVSRCPTGLNRRTGVINGVGHMIQPCLFNTLTTAGAFVSFTTSRMAVIREFGLFAAAGLIFAFITSIVLCIWALHWERTEPCSRKTDFVQRVVGAIVNLGVRRPFSVLVAAAAIAVGAGFGLARLEIDTYSLELLPERHPVRRDAKFIETQFGAYTPLEFVLHAREGTTLRPDVLMAVDMWQQRVEQDGLAGWSFSLVDPLKHANWDLTGVFQPPAPSDPIAGLSALILGYGDQAPEDYVKWVDAHGRLRVSFGIPMAAASQLGQSMETIRAAAMLPKDVTLTATGYIPLYTKMMDYVVDTQVSSFVLAFVIIFILIGLLFRSGWAMLLAVPTNLLPVLLVIGLMGWTGIRLDVATVTIGAIVLGLVVDDTIHLLHKLRHGQNATQDPLAGLRKSVADVGSAMLTSTIVLGFGFLVLVLAQVKSIAFFGFLMATALAAGIFADLLVLPALVALTGRKSGWIAQMNAPKGDVR